MIYKFIIFLYLSFQYNSYAQINFSKGARASSLANSTGASISFWSVLKNPASTVYLNNLSVGVDIRNDFMVKELSTSTIAVLKPINKQSNLGVYFQRFGYYRYNENKIAISYSKKLSESTSISVKMYDNTRSLNSDEQKYTNHLVGFNLGFFSKLSDNIHIGSYYIYQQKNSQLTTSLSWFPISELNILAEISKKEHQPFSLRSGVEYDILNRIYTRIGVSSHPLDVTLGVGVYFSSFNIDISVVHNEYLGSGTGLSSSYIFNK